MKGMKAFAALLIWAASITPSLAQGDPGSVAATATTIDVDQCFDFADGYAVVVKNGRPGLINAKGELLIAYDAPRIPALSAAEGFINGLLCVRDVVTGKLGFLDTRLEVVIPCRYEANSVQSVGFNDGMEYERYNRFARHGRCLVGVLGTQGIQTMVISREGKTWKQEAIVPRKYPAPKHPKSSLGYSYLPVDANQPELFAMINVAFADFLHGDVARVKLHFTEKTPLSSAERGGSWKEYEGLVRLDGTLAVPPMYEEIGIPSEGKCAAMIKDAAGETKWGFIGFDGSVIIDFKFSNKPTEFHEGLSMITPKVSDGSFAIIDTVGKVLHEIKHPKCGPLDAFYFRNGLRRCSDNFIVDRSRDFEVVDLANDPLRPLALKSYAMNWIPRGLVKLRWVDIQRSGGGYGWMYNWFDERATVMGPYTLVGVMVDRAATQEFSWLRDGRGVIDESLRFIVPPIFEEVGHYDPASGLTRATYRPSVGPVVSGYVNPQGVFRVVKGVVSKY